MSRLKDRYRQIPNGFTYTQSETGWSAKSALGSHPSFDRLCAAVLQHRLGNPRFKSKWKTDLAGVEQDVETYNVRICQANGWTEFLADNQAPGSPPKMIAPNKLAGAVAGANKATAGIKLVVEWLGSGLKPVPITIANKRAAVCAVCPKNEDGGFLEKIGALAARDVKALMEVKSDMALRVVGEDKLKSCSACSCWLPLKVWTPKDLVQKNTSPAIRAALDPNCWILSEANEG